MNCAQNGERSPFGRAVSRWAPFAASSIALIVLLVAIAVPGKATPRTSVPFVVAVLVIEGLFLWRYFAGGRKSSTCYIVSVVLLALIVWELVSTDLRIAHPVRITTPENVFAVFPAR